MCSNGDRLYVAGGELNKIGSGRWMTQVWAYHSLNDDWRVVGELLHPRRHHAMCCGGTGRVYVAGGFGRYRTRLRSVAMLDTATGQWSELRELPDFMHGLSLMHNDDTLYAGFGLTVYNLTSSTIIRSLVDVDFSDYELLPLSAYRHIMYDSGFYYISERIQRQPLEGGTRWEVVDLKQLNIPQLKDPLHTETKLDVTTVTSKARCMMAAFSSSSLPGRPVLHVYKRSLAADKTGSLYEDVVIPPDLALQELHMASLPFIQDLSLVT